MKILLLEDDHLLNEAIGKYLTIKGHLVDSFRSGSCALKSIKEESFDLLIMDINVPNINGLVLFKILKEEKIEIPTIFISAIIDIDDISSAFNLGCADYIKKPFHLKELGLRINKILQSSYIPHSHIRLSKGYSLDMDNMTLWFNGEVQVLSEKHMKVLSLLALNRNNLVDYSLFQEYAWENTEVSIPTIRAEINRLKKILREEIIINIRNMGYMIKRPD